MTNLEATDNTITESDFVPYPKALGMLQERLGATPEELGAWIFMGPDAGGLAAYRNANELSPPPRFHFDNLMGEDYLSPMMSCWFCGKDIEWFTPASRYITGSELLDRWGQQSGIQAAAYIEAKIAELRLGHLHPTYGYTEGMFGDPTFPPLEAGLFVLADVERIEVEDGLAIDLERNNLESNLPEPVEGQMGFDNPNPNDIKSYESQINIAPANEGEEALAPEAEPSQPGIFKEGSPTCAVFRDMPDLRSHEVSIAFVGDKAASLAGNDMLEIRARGIIRRCALAELNLVDRRKGTLNKQAAVLVGLANKESAKRSQEAMSATLKRLRSLLKTHMGLLEDPFLPYDKATGWQPRFRLSDKRGLADQRAQIDAERRSVSYDQLEAVGLQVAAARDEFTEHWEDETDQWLSTHDPKYGR